MQEQQPQQKPAFVFNAGCGTLRSKPTRDAVMYFGSLTLPGAGPCYVRGHREKGSDELKLELQSAQSREVVATLVLPAGRDPEVEGTVKIKGVRKAFVVKATLRQGENGPYRVLRMPDVKAVSQQWE